MKIQNIMSLISVILNVYKRPEMLNKQIDAVLKQSVNVYPEDIHVWYNKPDSNIVQPDPDINGVKTYRCNWNTKFYGRFTLPLLCDTEYIAVLDDDLLPGKDWFRSCINTLNSRGTDGILGGSGILVGDMTKKFTKYGWNGIHSDKTEKVDFVGQAWVFRWDVARYMWYEKPYSWDNGEDIMFSYLAQKYGNIDTFVPSHPEGNKDLWCTSKEVSMEVGRDENASWRLGGHTQVRKEVITHCINNGWKII